MCIFQTNDATGEIFSERWLLDWNDEKENVFIWEYFTDLAAFFFAGYERISCTTVIPCFAISFGVVIS